MTQTNEVKKYDPTARRTEKQFKKIAAVSRQRGLPFDAEALKDITGEEASKMIDALEAMPEQPAAQPASQATPRASETDWNLAVAKKVVASAVAVGERGSYSVYAEWVRHPERFAQAAVGLAAAFDAADELRGVRR